MACFFAGLMSLFLPWSLPTQLPLQGPQGHIPDAQKHLWFSVGQLTFQRGLLTLCSPQRVASRLCLSCPSWLTWPFDAGKRPSDDLSGQVTPLSWAPPLRLSKGKCPTLVRISPKGPCPGEELWVEGAQGPGGGDVHVGGAESELLGGWLYSQAHILQNQAQCFPSPSRDPLQNLLHLSSCFPGTA